MFRRMPDVRDFLSVDRWGSAADIAAKALRRQARSRVLPTRDERWWEVNRSIPFGTLSDTMRHA